MSDIKSGPLLLAGFTREDAKKINANGFDIAGEIFVGAGNYTKDGRIVPAKTFRRAQWEHPVVEPDEEIYQIQNIVNLREKFSRYLERWNWSRGEVSNDYEIELLFQKMFEVCYSYIRLTQPKIAVFSVIPHEAYHMVLFEICVAMKIPTVVLFQSHLPGHFWILNHWSDMGNFKSSPINPEPLTADIAPPVAPPPYMNSVVSTQKMAFRTRLKAMEYFFKTLYYAIFNGEKNISKFRNKTHKFIQSIDNIAYYKKRDAIFSLSLQELNGRKFVYFPLHLEPEMVVDVLGGEYRDQLRVIKELRRKLPDDVVIAVKDNPKQTGTRRRDIFFERLSKIENIALINSKVSSFDLIERSEAVACISGTAGWEAIRMGKPVILFGFAFYRRLPGVWHIDDEWSLQQLQSYSLDKDQLKNAVQILNQSAWYGLEDGEIDRTWAGDNRSPHKISKALSAFINHNHL